MDPVRPVPLPPGSPVPSPTSDRFLICGLGSLGQYCVFNLKTFNIPGITLQIVGIDLQLPQRLEVAHLLDLLSEPLVVGDCCREDVLRRAGVEHCRAILLVTDSENVNIQAAIAARRLNPKIRLVVRSSRPRLNDLLEQQLGNFIALEPTEFAALNFALQGLGSGIRGTFEIEGQRLRVIEQGVEAGDRRFDHVLPVSAINKYYRLLNAQPSSSSALSTLPASPQAGGSPSQTFHRMAPSLRLQAGDRITYIERFDLVPLTPGTKRRDKRRDILGMRQVKRWFKLGPDGAKARLQRWLLAQPARQVFCVGLVLGLLLWAIGSVSLWLGVEGMSKQKALSAGMILLLGGYGDVFGGVEEDKVSVGLQVISLMITLTSLMFVFGGLGLLADSLISSRFSLLRQRPPIPEENHVILIGFGRVGRRVAHWLRSFRQAFVVIIPDPEQAQQAFTKAKRPAFRILLGEPSDLLETVNLATAKSVVIVTEDQLMNLELALGVRELAQKQQREIGLVVRTYDQQFSENLSNLLLDVNVLTAYALAAEAFAGAAFGEDILALFQLHNQTVLVTEYTIYPGDTLVGLQLAAVAYGYGVVPIFHRRAALTAARELHDDWMPSDDIVLQGGDRLIVLSSSNGLRRIEYGQLTPAPRWRLTVQTPLNPEFLHSGGSALARISGQSLAQCRDFMTQLPSHLDLALYPYQAVRLEQALSNQLLIELVPLP